MLIPFFGDNVYTNLCTNSNVWLNDDSISTFSSLVLVSHYCHTIDISATLSGKDLPQLMHVTYPNMQLGQSDYKQLPSSIKWIVAVMHHTQHDAIMDIILATKIIKVVDSLSCPLLGWQDHIIIAMKSACWWIDLLLPLPYNLFPMTLLLKLLVAAGGQENTLMAMMLLLHCKNGD
jgi:hypothetical protein